MPDVQTLVTTGLFHLPVYAPKYWSIFCTQVYLSTYVQSYDMLCDAQLGFHPNRSCDTQLITTVNDFAEVLNRRGQCDVLALDFSKDFNKVWHAHLYQKLSHYGVHGSILSWLQAFLTDRSQYVILDNMKKLCYLCTLRCATRNSISPFIVPNVHK